MPARVLFDVSDVDLDHVAVGKEEIERINPQRFEFQQLTSVCHIDVEQKIIVGVRDILEDEFWIRGHVPGHPIFPGVLLIEAAAQLCSVYTAKVTDIPDMYGFGGTDNVRFRKVITVGDRLVIVARGDHVTSRRSRFTTQALVEGKVVFEASIFGIALPA